MSGTLIHLLDSRSGAVVERIEDAHEGAITCVEWAPVKWAGPDGKYSVFATGSLDGRVRLWRGPKMLV